MKTRTSWREKMYNPKLPKVEAIPPKMRKRYGNGTMLIPSPPEVEAAIRAIPEGDVSTVAQIRAFLAAKYQADVTCPLVTGIFVRIAAEAAEQEASPGSLPQTPYWRVVGNDGSLNGKFPGGAARQAERLRAEGQRIISGTGKRPPRVVLAASGGR